jgi:hypothetical protein
MTLFFNKSLQVPNPGARLDRAMTAVAEIKFRTAAPSQHRELCIIG